MRLSCMSTRRTMRALYWGASAAMLRSSATPSSVMCGGLRVYRGGPWCFPVVVSEDGVHRSGEGIVPLAMPPRGRVRQPEDCRGGVRRGRVMAPRVGPRDSASPAGHFRAHGVRRDQRRVAALGRDDADPFAPGFTGLEGDL